MFIFCCKFDDNDNKWLVLIQANLHFFLLFTPCGVLNCDVDVEANAARHGNAEQILARGGE